MEVEGIGRGKDFKLWPSGGRTWDWDETGTHHQPGIQPSDVAELVKNGCSTIVLSRGRLLRLRTCPETFDFLCEHGISVQVAETVKAIGIYNEFAKSGKAVGGLFHSTC